MPPIVYHALMRWLRSSVRILATIQVLVGVGGIRGDLKGWGEFSPVLDHWLTHYFLCVSGMVAITYPQWLPWVRRQWVRPPEDQPPRPVTSLPPPNPQPPELILVAEQAPLTPELPFEPPEPAPEKPQPKASLKDRRVFSPRTPEQLLDEVKGKTEMAAQLITKRHIGQWLRGESEIVNISQDKHNDKIYVGLLGPFSCYFSDSWKNKLAGYNPRDRIRVIGQIEKISPMGIIRLVDCELVED